MKCLNNFFIIFTSMWYLCLPTLAAFDIDTSVDDEIRKKYNTKKIEEDLLPPLPDNLKNDIQLKSNENFSKPVLSTSPLKEVKDVQKTKNQHITLKKGTKFTVRLTSGVSDKSSVGTKIYFKLSKPIKTKYFSLTENTRFIGVVVDSHSPQLSGNGGLIVIKVDNVTINGRSQEINAKITKANYKNIYFNNIKGNNNLNHNDQDINLIRKLYEDKIALLEKLLNNAEEEIERLKNNQ